MKKIYLLVIGTILCFSSFAQIGERNTAAFNDLKEHCGGSDWTIKTIDELLKKTKSPYITKGDGWQDSDFGVSSYAKIFDLSNNNLKGEVRNEFFYRPDYEKLKYVWRSIRTSLIMSHNHINTINKLMCYDQSHKYLKVVKFDNNEIAEFNHYVSQEGSQVGVGTFVLTMHQNEIQTLKKENLANATFSAGICENRADTLRFDNNRLNFEALCVLTSTVKELTRYHSYYLPGNPDFYFDYYPQKPLGKNYTEYMVAKGKETSVSFSSPAPHPKNVFSWQLNGVDVPLSTGRSHNFVLNENTAGVWRCKITNPELPEVTLYSKDKACFMTKPSNKAITDFAIKQNPLSKNFPEDCIIADFSAVDPDGDEVFYRLPDTLADNSHFRIKDGKVLVSAEPLFDRYYIEKYDIKVVAYDVYGGKLEKTFEIIKDPTNTGVEVILPHSVKLSANKVPENTLDTEIGKFSFKGVESLSLSLEDEKENKHFRLDGLSLFVKEKLNYEIKKKYSIRVKAITPEGGVLKKDFFIDVTDNNDAPDDVIITNNTIKVNIASGTKLGMLMASDEDPKDKNFKYAFAEGYKDNADFVLLENVIKVKTVFTDPVSKTLGITVTDPQGAQFTKELIITVVSDKLVNKQPLGFGITNCVVNYDLLVGDVIGTFYMNDPEGEIGIFTCDNEFVEVEGSKLRLKKLLDRNSCIDVIVKCKDEDYTILNTFTLFTKPDESNHKPRGFGLVASDITNRSKVGDLVGTFYMSDMDGSLGVFSCDNEFVTIEGSVLKLKKLPARGTDINVEVTCTDKDFAIETTFTIINRIPAINTKPSGIGLTSCIIGKDMKKGSNIGFLILSDVEGAKGEFICTSEYVEIENRSLRLKKKPTEENSISVEITAKDGEFSLSQTFVLINELTVSGVNTKPSCIGLTAGIIGKDMKKDAIIGSFILADAEGAEGVFTCSSEYVEIVGRNLCLKKKSTEVNSISVEVTAVDGEFSLSQTFVLTNELEEAIVPTVDPTIRGFGLTSTVIAEDMKVGNLIAYLFSSENTGVVGTFTCDNEYLEISGNELRLKAIPEVGTNFNAKITCSNGGSDLDHVFTFYILEAKDVVTGINNVKKDNDVIIYPNPVSNYLQVKGVRSNSNTNYIVYNMKGLIVKSTNKLPIDVQDLSSGTYIIKFHGDDVIESKRFIKK